MVLCKKIAIMHSKGEFSKIKGSICNITIETANICIFLWSLNGVLRSLNASTVVLHVH